MPSLLHWCLSSLPQSWGIGLAQGVDLFIGARSPTPHRLRPRPFRHRRLQPSGLFRGAQRRDLSDQHWLLASSQSIFLELRNHHSMGLATAQKTSPLSSSMTSSSTPSPSPTNLKPTARSNASTGLSSNEWAYARPYRSEAARTRALDTWLHLYNHHRHHTAIGGPPISRVNNLVGQNRADSTSHRN
jgi:hypothetical protein